jgi:hypothetical protein
MNPVAGQTPLLAAALFGLQSKKSMSVLLLWSS